jgi:hypothetical protein
VAEAEADLDNRIRGVTRIFEGDPPFPAESPSSKTEIGRDGSRPSSASCGAGGRQCKRASWAFAGRFRRPQLCSVGCSVRHEADGGCFRRRGGRMAGGTVFEEKELSSLPGPLSCRQNGGAQRRR